GTFAAQVALKHLTSELVGRFASAAVTETRKRYGDGRLTRYAADLVVPDRVAAEVALLKALALRYVMADPERRALQARQRELLTELFHTVLRRAPESLDPAFRPAWDAAGDDSARLRVVVDQIASLTDGQALRWHRELSGIG
ncbi:MAG TPA: deoxyguanosinetriphosphate triphosphohydrolase, partial [Pseudonocardiaceae bacterium]|nr:deoxyguanosinetriphosphate triphosphohydrolase [Pseudonocardiaceae bacterium]